MFFGFKSRRVAGLVMAITLVAASDMTRAAAAPQQPRDDSRRASESRGAVVKGRVVAADTGSPLRRAQVRLISATNRQSVVGTTDSEGAYEFRDLPAGRYAVVATKGGFVQTQYGQRRAFVAGTPIELRAGDTLERVDIRVVPGAAIDGRVLDEFGEPVADVVVMTMRPQYAAGRKRVVNVGRVLTTNERGEFHLFGLPPGSYYLSATLMGNENVADAANRAGYAPSYYPGTTDVAAAETITLSEGEQRVGLNLGLVAERTATLSGMAFDSDQHPLGGGQVTVVSSTSGIPIPIGTAAIDPDGAFSVRNVPPGRFTILAASSNAAAPAGLQEIASQLINVAGQDLTGLMLAAPKSGMVSGRVAAAAGETAPLPGAMQLRLIGAKPADDTVTNGTLARTNADGTFRVVSRPGALLIELAGAPPGWFLKQVLQGGIDVTDAGIQLNAGGKTEALEVLVARQTTTVSGTVIDDAKRPVAQYAVAVFSRDRDRWSYRSRYVASARPDQDGRFSIRGLPPGQYVAVAVDYIEQGEAQDPLFLDSYHQLGKPVTLGDNDIQSVTLPLTRRP